MSSSALAKAVATLLEHESVDASSRQHVDTCISLRLADVSDREWVRGSDEELIEVGGRWDRRAKCYRGEATKVMAIRVHKGQEAAARWLAEWFRRRRIGPSGPHWGDPENRIWSVLLLGGRRGGKSHLAVVSLVMAAVMMPGSRCWAVSPTQEETDELEVAVRSMLPRHWYSFRGGGAGKSVTFKLANGSRILCLSGHRPSALKRGRCDFAVYNEAQNQTEKGWHMIRGAIADTAGLCVLAANPPDREAGRYIEMVHEQARAHKNAVELFSLTAAENPFVEFEALADMRKDINDELTYRREILGEMIPIGDTVMHAWSDSESVRTVPADFVDVTPEFTREKLGRAFGYVVGIDLQQTPHMCAAIFRFYRDPAEPGEIIAWVVDEVVVDDADENDLIDALEAKGYRGWFEPGDDKDRPTACASVVDASAWWQDGAHTKGRTSDKALRARQWTFLYKPQPDSDKNPEIVERVKATNSRLKTATGRRRMFSAPENTRINRAMRSWENRNGVPSRKSDFAHLGDAVSYVIYRFFGRPKVPRGKQEYRGIRRERPDQMRGW